MNKDNAVYYLNGKMANTYYLGTTEAPKSGVDVYLEETTGGYYLYAAIDGARKYLNMTDCHMGQGHHICRGDRSMQDIRILP